MKKPLISLILTVLILGGYQYGYFAANYSCIVYPDQCDDDKESSGQSLGKLIVDAASYLLQSNSDYQLFLKNFENSELYGVNQDVFREIIDNATGNMENANRKYLEIWEISKGLNYNALVLEKLRQFDYEKFQKENNLNPSIFQEVTHFLKEGNVNGIYERSFNVTGDILRGLKIIKASIDSGSIPAVKDCWRINQEYLELEFFGQYVSQVFFDLKHNWR